MVVKQHRTGPETERLLHRAFEVDDAEDFFALNSHPDVMRLTGEAPCPSVEAARAGIAAYPDFREVGFGRWACVLKRERRVIGFSGLKYLPEFDEVDLGYRFLPEYWGRGLATESGRACLDFGFRALDLSSIVGYVLPGNAASVRVLDKLGFEPAGEIEYDGIPGVRRFVIHRP